MMTVFRNESRTLTVKSWITSFGKRPFCQRALHDLAVSSIFSTRSFPLVGLVL